MSVFEEYYRRLDELNSWFTDALLDERAEEGSCACGSGCCGDRDHCSPCELPPPPASVERMWELRDKIGEARLRAERAEIRANQLQVERDSAHEFHQLAQLQIRDLKQTIARLAPAPRYAADFGKGFI